ncbi:hypothetical protein [Deminuibacter soli]|uniref:Uncharacterized protein n=1 Tax=Deminuibacter soli TaxID=2291815 RepID=A0A3E1NCR4_9BACT|nr:hypothetical protein [Deminuibacter soli]RFM25776.1 hypothetical protein DXN05_23400 [Deminuibacter soli]
MLVYGLLCFVSTTIFPDIRKYPEGKTHFEKVLRTKFTKEPYAAGYLIPAAIVLSFWANKNGAFQQSEEAAAVANFV